MKNEKTSQNASMTQETTPKSSIVKTDADGKKTLKLNADYYAKWKKNETHRSTDEERLDKPSLIHFARNHFASNESDGYYYGRKLTFDITGLLDGTPREYRTPQSNLDLLLPLLNSRLPKESRIVRSVYYAREFQFRFYFANSPKKEYTAIDVSKPQNAKDVLKRLNVVIA